jgi:hypothetical protein
MNAPVNPSLLDRPTNANTQADSRYAKCIEVSKRIRWDIDRDVIRGRSFDTRKPFMPEGLSQLERVTFLTPSERLFMSQIQGRTYTNIFGLVERYIGAKVMEVSRDDWFGDQVALEALVRFTDEELKHQELFRRLEKMTAEVMPAGYTFLPQPNDVAQAVLSKSTWAVLALTCDIELFTQAHYRSSIEARDDLCPLWKDVFLFHWKEESQHAILDELEWRRENAKITDAERDAAVDDLIALVGAVDGILQMQAGADVQYFAMANKRRLGEGELAQLQAATLAAYRYQYIVSGVSDPRFQEALGSMITSAQFERIGAALAPILDAQ